MGDGIREGLKSLSELVNRSGTKAFSLGLIEVALYKMKNGSLLMQPRVLAQTEVLTRQITVVKVEGGGDVTTREDDSGSDDSERETNGGGKDHLKAWWQPILAMKFDDPEQEPSKWVGTNNVILNTPFPGIHIKAWASTKSNDMGVAVAGTRTENVEAISEFIQRDKRFLREQLPENTRIDSSGGWPIYLHNNEEVASPNAILG